MSAYRPTWMTNRWAIVPWLVLTLLVGCNHPTPTLHRTATPSASQPVAHLPMRVQELVRTIDDQPIRGWAAWVDLTDPRVEIRVTGPIQHEPNDPRDMEVRAETTPHWLEREHLTLAINTQFFKKAGDPNAPLEPNLPLDLMGPVVSAGRVVSPPPAAQPSPALVLKSGRRARIGLLTANELTGMDEVVSGAPPLGRAPNDLLVEDGRNTGAMARVQPLKRHPRTAIGLTLDGATLIVAVVDGRQPEWSIGMTLLELGDLMLELGAWDAIALDGGGSSSFIFAPPDGPMITNRPSDGHWRAVGASLGVYVRPGS